MNIWITAPFDEVFLEKLRQRASVTYESWEHTHTIWEGSDLHQRLSRDCVGILVTEIDVLSEDVLTGLTDLRMICACRANPCNVDVKAAVQNGVVVTNTPARNCVAVAELTIGLLFCAVRRISEGDRLVRESDWDDYWYFSLASTELAGRTVGIVGLGAIGREVAKRARGLDMLVMAYDPYVSQEAAGRVGARLVDLETLMREADFVSVHLPVTEETQGLVSADLVAMMKPTAYFINTARTATTDEQAVLKALKEHRIAGGAFDVFGEEPLPADSPYLALDNVVLTPHIGGAARQVATNQSEMVYTDILRFMKKQTPIHIVGAG